MIITKPIQAISFLFLLTTFVGMLAGCGNNTAKETLRVEGGVLYYRSELAQWSFLSFSKAEAIEHVTPLSSTCIGLIESESDPNSIDSASSLVGQALKVALTK